MRRPGLAAALYVGLVFMSGAVVGVFGDRLYTAGAVNANVAGPKPADYRKRYVEEMTKRLTLSPDQVTQLGAILDDTRTKFHEEHDRSKQQLAQIHEEQVQKIHDILTPSQLPEYEKYRIERDKDRELREKNSKDKK
jgi:hypothetical protein